LGWPVSRKVCSVALSCTTARLPVWLFPPCDYGALKWQGRKR
jgi:hypothetical protein